MDAPPSVGSVESGPGAGPVTPGFKRANQQKRKMVTAYILFSADVRKITMDENPGQKFGEISRIVAERWRQMSDADKQVSVGPYNDALILTSMVSRPMLREPRSSTRRRRGRRGRGRGRRVTASAWSPPRPPRPRPAPPLCALARTAGAGQGAELRAPPLAPRSDRSLSSTPCHPDLRGCCTARPTSSTLR